MCKLFSSEVAERVSSLAVNMRRLRVREGLPRRETVRDAKIGQIYEGTSNLQLQTMRSRSSVRRVPPALLLRPLQGDDFT